MAPDSKLRQSPLVCWCRPGRAFVQRVHPQEAATKPFKGLRVRCDSRTVFVHDVTPKWIYYLIRYETGQRRTLKCTPKIWLETIATNALLQEPDDF